MSEGIVAQEDDAIESVQDHAYFRCRIPSDVAAGWKVRSIEAVAAASTHRFEQSGTIRTIECVLLLGRVSCDGRDIDVC